MTEHRLEFTLIAHRGYSSRAPENTFHAFDLALEKGFANFELDAQLSRDGQLVVFHDETVDRVTDGTGYVWSLTLAELQALNAAAKFKGDGDFADARIPTLHEFLGRYAGSVHPHLELKSREAELPALVADALKTHGWLGVAETGTYETPGLTISSFWADQLYRSKVRLPNVRHGWLVNEVTTETVAAALKLGFDAVYPRAGTARPETVAHAHDRGLSVRGWGIGDDDDLARIFKSGATGTTVNWPGEAAEFLESMA